LIFIPKIGIFIVSPLPEDFFKISVARFEATGGNMFFFFFDINYPPFHIKDLLLLFIG